MHVFLHTFCTSPLRPPGIPKIPGYTLGGYTQGTPWVYPGPIMFWRGAIWVGLSISPLPLWIGMVFKLRTITRCQQLIWKAKLFNCRSPRAPLWNVGSCKMDDFNETAN